MKHYLSFGGGVNSVALHLLMIQEKFDFEAVFVNHGTDWPETYEYFEIFQDYLKTNGHRPVTVLFPNVQGYDNLYDYALRKRIIPFIYPRWCTSDFKVKVVNKYIEKPCFMHLGIAAEESKRAKIGTHKGIENRWLLLEYDIDRDGCKKLIEKAGLPVPIKSGCFICPFQRPSQFRELRMKHPDLFCKASLLEEVKNDRRKEEGKSKFSLHPSGKTLESLVDENQTQLFEIDEYPPCQCML